MSRKTESEPVTEFSRSERRKQGKALRERCSAHRAGRVEAAVEVAGHRQAT